MRTAFHKAFARDKGVFNGRNIHILTDNISWVHLNMLMVTDQGQLYLADDLGTPYMVLLLLLACLVQILVDGTPQSTATRRKTRQDDSLLDEPPVLLIRTYDNDRLYLKVLNRTTFGNLVASLMVWQNLRPVGLAKKWYLENRASRSVVSDLPHEVLVCRCKVYGPLPRGAKTVKPVPGPPAPCYLPRGAESELLDPSTPAGSLLTAPGGGLLTPQEGWFYAMGVLKLNGVLNFITELDGTLLYSLDVKNLMLLEIRQMHHLIFDNLNVLFVGHLAELRWNNAIKTTAPPANPQDDLFLLRDGRPLPLNNRLMIEFPLHIDLEDWYVGLNYFARREYIGAYSLELPRRPKAHFATTKPTANSTPALTPYSATFSERSDRSQATIVPVPVPPPAQDVVSNPSTTTSNSDEPLPLVQYPRENLRVLKNVSIDIIEAKFDTLSEHLRIYAEVVMWGYLWLRTAIVPHTLNPFWKQEFSTNLPILTQMVHILIKQCRVDPLPAHGPVSAGYAPEKVLYSLDDRVIGTVYITPDILTKQLQLVSTMLLGGVDHFGTPGTAMGPAGNGNGVSGAGMTGANDIVRLLIYDLANVPVGRLLLTVSLKEHHILAPRNFKTLESMLLNAPMKELIRFCNTNVPSLDFESVSVMMLDIFQLLGIEDRWFKLLMEAELVNIDKITRQNYVNKRNSGVPNVPTATKLTNNVFNTLFRGLLIFLKSLEKYNLRIGQEYLEKVFGDFFLKVLREKKNCEVDPRYVRREMEDLDAELDLDDDAEEELVSAVKFKVEENFDNLLQYADEIWNKIYITSNDLPQQIKTQLKNFRTKVEFACDPEDKTTALNCLSAFIFLRFFCPAILNPKLFYLTKDHQTGETQRTLTLIAKILLNLANRQEFLPHKEPHLVRMNHFLAEHREEVLDYFDRITGRKNDFHEKILDLLHEVKRFDLGLLENELLELPTTPYLIDKYHRLTELIQLLDYLGESSRLLTILKRLLVELLIAARQLERDSAAGGSRDSADIKINRDRNVYQIGLLEFEKLDFLDLAGDNETEGFLKLLCRLNENIFLFITLNITLKDLQKQSTNLRARIAILEHFLEDNEVAANFQADQKMWDAFTEDVLSRAYLNTTKNTIVYVNAAGDPVGLNMKKITENALSSLKLKFPEEQDAEQPNKTAYVPKPKKNPFKKWLKASGL